MEIRSSVLSRRAVLGSAAVGLSSLALPAAAQAASAGGSGGSGGGGGSSMYAVTFQSSGSGSIGGVDVTYSSVTATDGGLSTAYEEDSSVFVFQDPSSSGATLSFASILSFASVDLLDVGSNESFALTFRRAGNLISTQTFAAVGTVLDQLCQPSGGFDSVTITYTGVSSSIAGIRFWIPGIGL